MSKLIPSQLLCCICYLLSASRCLAQTDYEADLVSYLKSITNFSPLVTPTLNQSQGVTVTMDTMLGQIVSVDTAKQSIKIAAFLSATWEDQRLVWDPKSYGGVRTINWDSNVWVPVIMLYNGIGDDQVLSVQIPVYLTSMAPNSTQVTAAWRREFEFSCSFSMTQFPIDRHMCELEFFFSDQGHGNKLLRPVQNTIYPFNKLALYKNNSEWILENFTAYATQKSYNLIEGVPIVNLPTYVMHLEIQRVSTYYLMNVITPLLLLTLLQVLVYFVPVESGEKLGFGITIMLSYTVFLLMLDGILPKTQAMPAVASFITAAMVLSTISLLLTSLIMRFHFTPEGTRMPACARAVFVRFLGRMFCVRGAGRTQIDDTPDNLDKGGAGKTKTKDDAADEPRNAGRSDWILAAHAIERLMVALGVIATVAIIAVFVIAPYARR